MKSNALFLSACTAMLLAACAGNTPPATQGAPVENHNGTTDTTSTNKVDTDKVTGVVLDNVTQMPKDQAIYFDYNEYTVKDSYKTLLENHVAYQKKTPKTKVLIQGNADPRGSREYNLALGQKRANAVKQSLELLGADSNRVEAVSLGEEKPVCESVTEACYAQDRRADVVYQGQ